MFGRRTASSSSSSTKSMPISLSRVVDTLRRRQRVVQAKVAQRRGNAQSSDALLFGKNHENPSEAEGASVVVADYALSSVVQPVSQGDSVHEDQEDSAQIREAILASQVTANKEELLRTRLEMQLQEAIEASRSKTCASAPTLGLALGPSADIAEEELSVVLATLQATLQERGLSVVGEDGEENKPTQKTNQVDDVSDGSSGPLNFDLATLAMVEGIQRTLHAAGLDGDIEDAQAWDALDQWWCEDAEASEAARCMTLAPEDEASTSRQACSIMGGA